MAILRKTNKERYTTFLHSISLDENLSLKDFGLLIKLLSLPDDWKFSEKGLEKILKKDGQTSIRTAIKNLEKYGYLRRERIREKNGQVGDVIWYIYEEPQVDNPPEKPEDEPDFENHNQDDCDIKNPDFENHSWEKSSCETHKQYNIKEYNIKEYNTKTKEDVITNNEKKFDNIIENFCDGNCELENKLKDFVQMRSQSKKNLTEFTLKELLNRLVEVSEGNKELMVKVVKKSIRNGWSDFYKPYKKEQKTKTVSYSTEEYENLSNVIDYLNSRNNRDAV